MRERGHHRLLAHHPVQVAARQIVALAYEAQRLGAVELLSAGREVGTRHRFEHRFLEANLDTAEGVGDQCEAEQPDLCVVIDRYAGEVGDRLDQRLATGLGALRLGVRGGNTGLNEAGPFCLLGLAVDAVDLGLAEAGGRDVRVAGNRDRGGRPPVVGDADQDDGGGIGRDVVSGPQGRQFGV